MQPQLALLLLFGFLVSSCQGVSTMYIEPTTFIKFSDTYNTCNIKQIGILTRYITIMFLRENVTFGAAAFYPCAKTKEYFYVIKPSVEWYYFYINWAMSAFLAYKDENGKNYVTKKELIWITKLTNTLQLTLHHETKDSKGDDITLHFKKDVGKLRLLIDSVEKISLDVSVKEFERVRHLFLKSMFRETLLTTNLLKKK